MANAFRPLKDLERSHYTGGRGIGQTITTGAAAINNDLPLPVGRYAVKCLTGWATILGPVIVTASAAATDWRIDANEILVFDVTENEQFISVLQGAGGDTLRIVGTDDTTREVNLLLYTWN